MNGLNLLFQVVDGVDELLLSWRVHAFRHLGTDVMHEFPDLLDLVERDVERVVERIERVKPQEALIQMTLNDFEHYSVVNGEDDIRLTVVDLVPVEDVFTGDV